MESECVELENLPFSVKAAVQRAFDLFTPIAEKKGLRLTFEVESRIPAWVSGDANRLTQILNHLLSNAIKFTPSGLVEVRLSSDLESKREKRHLFHVSIRDSGIGVSEDVQAVLFRNFTGAAASVAGARLARCRSQCEEMGGRIWFSSAEGQGSKFDFTFTAVEVETAKSYRDRVLTVDPSRSNIVKWKSQKTSP